jgi:Uma2 family endonuclease
MDALPTALRYAPTMTLARDLVPPELLRPLRRTEYERMADLGMFEGEKVELLHGRIVRMTPQGEPHAFSITRLNKLLVRAVGDRADVRVQMPLAVSDVSEPEPDFAVVPPADYLDGHPSTALLVIEVARSSLDHDRRVKAPLYAAAGIPEYSIVNLPEGIVEVLRGPHTDGYATTTRYDRSAVIELPGFAGASIAVGEIIPAR